MDYPVFTFSSGPTNSMRGAMFLSGKKDGIVVDIGGTTTDVGILKLINGFPREASSQVKVLLIVAMVAFNASREVPGPDSN